MAKFYIYETTSLTLKFTPTEILDDYKHIIISIAQGKTQLNINENDLEIDTTNDTITFSLSQEETGLFEPGKAYIQVNIYYESTERNVSTCSAIDICDNLYKKVIDNE